MKIGPRLRTGRRSVVSVGTVQSRKTLSPLRTARRSVTGSGRSNDGAFGTPGTPQPTRVAAPDISRRFKRNCLIGGRTSLPEKVAYGGRASRPSICVDQERKLPV